VSLEQPNPNWFNKQLTKGGSDLRKVFTGALAVMMILSLAACTASKGDQKVRVKCPACGYEFDAPIE
jgi:hypothetical protein